MVPHLNRTPAQHGAAARRGAALLFIVVMLFVTSLMLVTLTQGVIRQHRQQRHERDRWQAEFCADAALDRLAIVLRDAPETTSHVWTTVPDATRPGATAVVTTTIAALPAGRRVTAVTDFPAGSTHRVRIRRVIDWPVEAATMTTALGSQPVSALNLENVP